MGTLNDRRKKIMFAVISEYVSTADPVGSRTISKRYELDLSPATIRNVMSDLEEMGYFVQPHTSSGRVPTDKAFRFYIEELAHNPLDPAIEEEMRQRTGSMDDLRAFVSDSSKALSEMTQYTGVGLTPRMSSTAYKHIQFIKLQRRQLLVVFVTSSNIVHNRMVNFEHEVKQPDLDRMSNYLNAMLSGLTLEACRVKLIDEMHNARAQYDQVLRRAVEMGQAVLSDADGQVIIEGGSKMLHEPEFGDPERARSLFRVFEEKSMMVRLLDKALAAPGVHIWMGSEAEDNALDKCAVVTGAYGAGGKLLGTVGVIGPMRMDYAKVVPLVEYTSKLITAQLETLYADKDIGDSDE